MLFYFRIRADSFSTASLPARRIDRAAELDPGCGCGESEDRRRVSERFCARLTSQVGARRNRPVGILGCCLTDTPRGPAGLGPRDEQAIAPE
jgi:hypothetical protein